MRSSKCNFPSYSVLIGSLAVTIGIGILAAPSKGHAQNATSESSGSAISVRFAEHGIFPTTAFALAAEQDSGQGAAPSPVPSKSKSGELPDGEGKTIAEAACQTCHKLTYLTDAYKSLDDWRDTVQVMIDRGANVPADKVETLVQYLAKNFGVKRETSAADSQAAPSPAVPATPAPPGAAAKANVVELPEGDGKAIAEKYCQTCHKLTNITKAHKNKNEWADSVGTMIDRGCDIPQDKVDTLVQYLAKNFPSKDAAPAGDAPASGGASSPQPQ